MKRHAWVVCLSHKSEAVCVSSSKKDLNINMLANNSMQRTALRAAADAERYADMVVTGSLPMMYT